MGSVREEVAARGLPETKEACWQEAEAYPYMQDTISSTEDGNSLSIRVGNKVFEVDEHEVISP